jgi:hypothetical protein
MCKKLIYLVLLLAFCLMSSVAADTININFRQEGTQPEDHFIIEPGEMAGAEDWATDNWNNVALPWARTFPEEREVTSVEGATFQMTVLSHQNVENFEQDYFNGRLTSEADANGDLHAGGLMAFSGGAPPGDIGYAAIFEVTGLSIFGRYDVVLYVSAGHDDTFGGTATANGQTRSFITSKFDGTMTEIVNDGDTGNYIVFKGLRGDTLHVEAVSDADYNFLDVAAVQIVSGNPGLAGNPNPPDEATDVPRDVVLSWTAGIYADKHDVLRRQFRRCERCQYND